MSSDEDLSSSEEEEQITDLRNSDVVTKYQEAAKIVNLTLRGIIGKCKAGTGKFLPHKTLIVKTVKNPFINRAILLLLLLLLLFSPSLMPDCSRFDLDED